MFAIFYNLTSQQILQMSALLLLVLASLALSTYQQSYYLCNKDQFFDLQHCEACSPNCICTAIKTCTSCIDGYTMFNGNCIQCPQASGIYGACSSCCSHTAGTQLTCTDCLSVANSYTFLYSGRCLVSPGCFQIDNNGFCNECFPGFYERNNLCFACHSSCATCTDSTNCITCAKGYYWGIANGGRCTGCPSGCSTCDSQGLCSSCLDGFYLYQEHCLSCPTNCKSCSDGSTCTSCSAGILISNLCILCTDTTYSGSSGCSTCVNINNFVSCTKCDDTYFLTTTGVCNQCSVYIPGALRCRDQNTPTQCQNDFDATYTNRYYLVGITCIQNTKKCRKISDIHGNCSICYPDYTLLSGECTLCPFTGCDTTTASVVVNICTCTVCLSGYYLSGVNCLACPLNCAVCPAGTCTACSPGYHLSVGSCVINAPTNCKVATSSVVCTTCQPGYYKGANNLCYSCQSNCLTCTTRFACSTCAITHYLHIAQSACLPLPAQCITIDASYACTLCSHGYYLSNGYCLPCKVELGTLNKCKGLCPIDYYIQGLVFVGLSGVSVAYFLISALLLLIV